MWVLLIRVHHTDVWCQFAPIPSHVSSKHLTLYSAPTPPTPATTTTHHPPTPPPPFWQTIFSDCIFLNENDRIPIQISLNHAPRSPIDKKPALVQVMAWRRTGGKPLPEPMMAQFSDVYMRHYGEDELTWYKLKGAMKHIKYHKIFIPYHCKITQKR